MYAIYFQSIFINKIKTIYLYLNVFLISNSLTFKLRITYYTCNYTFSKTIIFLQLYVLRFTKLSIEGQQKRLTCYNIMIEKISVVKYLVKLTDIFRKLP